VSFVKALEIDVEDVRFADLPSLFVLSDDSGDVIPLPFRMSAFVPTNLLVVGGMLTPNPTLATVSLSDQRSPNPRLQACDGLSLLLFSRDF